MKRRIGRLWGMELERPWQGRAHRFFFWACAICLSLLLTCALFVSRVAAKGDEVALLAALPWAVVIFGAVLAALLWLARQGGGPSAPETRGKLNLRAFAGTSLASFCLLMVFLLAANPGGVSVDSAVQWTQANTGVFTNWHPVFHTLLLRLCALVWPSYPFAVAVQCALYSLALGYLVATLMAWGARRLPLLAVALGLTAAPIVGNTLMYLWKDNAMTVGVLVLTAQTVNLYYTRGAWLSKTRNALGFGLALALTTMVRHNAFFFTLPLLGCALLCWRGQARGGLTALAALVTVLALVWGPLYAALHVTYPANTLEESVGVPMTVISNIRKLNPDALDAETRAFTDAMADDAGWETYRPDVYNTIKFGHTRELMAHASLSQILRMAVSAAKADPIDALNAVNGVTDLVWGLADEGAANVKVSNIGDLPSVPEQNGRSNRLGEALKALITAPLSILPISWYVGNLGVSFAAMLALALRALRRNGVRALALCLPVLLYNLGTMCVLCGPDARFFSFSPLVCTLSLFVLWRDPPPEPTKNAGMVDA